MLSIRHHLFDYLLTNNIQSHSFSCASQAFTNCHVSHLRLLMTSFNTTFHRPTCNLMFMYIYA